MLKDLGRSEVKMSNGGYKRKYLCSCGKEFTAYKGHITAGSTVSCGCVKSANARTAPITHGQSYSTLYRHWWALYSRCSNPNNNRYHRYGGRGIKLEFTNFEHFYETMGKSHFYKAVIHRINNNKGYSPENCEWLTIKEHGFKHRKSQQLLTTFAEPVV